MDEDLLALTSALVAIESINPALVPGGSGEREVAAYVAAWAEGEGLDATLVGPRERPSVLVHSNPAGAGGRLLLCGHLDTVGVDGMTSPLVPRIDGDRLHGRGGYDMKAGVAAALIACREAHRLGLAGDVVVAAVADEEHASLGVQEALRHVTADAAIVTEPTEMTVAVAHKGFVWSEIEVTGRAAHGSRPHLGVDAIVKAGPVLVALGELDRRLAAVAHPLVGAGSVHAGTITGGVELSSYPDRCVIGVERRTVPGERAAAVERDLDALLDGCRRADPALVAAQRTVLVREPFEVDSAAAIVRQLLDATERVLGGRAPVEGASFWADSAFIAAAGIPTVLFGPSGEGAHAREEWVSIADTTACARVLVAVAQAVCR